MISDPCPVISSTEHYMPSIFYLPDTAVDPGLDMELRTLLSACFTQPHHAVFREHRHFCYPPQHRWLMRDQLGRLIAQIAVHERQVEAARSDARAAGPGP